MSHVTVKLSGKGYTTDVTFGKHHLVADEPEELGGEDRGMSPLPLLLSSLGSCMAMTMRMYANRKDWPLEGAEVRLIAEVRKSGLQQTTYIRSHIKLLGSLTAEQKRRIFEISEKCPIKRVLSNPVVVDNNLLDVR